MFGRFGSLKVTNLELNSGIASPFRLRLWSRIRSLGHAAYLLDFTSSLKGLFGLRWKLKCIMVRIDSCPLLLLIKVGSHFGRSATDFVRL